MFENTRAPPSVTNTEATADQSLSVGPESRAVSFMPMISAETSSSGFRELRTPQKGMLHLGGESWRELWTVSEEGERIVIWQDVWRKRIIDFCGDETVARSVQLVEEDWVQNAIAFGRNMANKAQGSGLEHWFTGASPLWFNLLDAARIDFVAGPVNLTDPGTRLIKQEEDTLSHKERIYIRLQRLRKSFDARGAARRQGRKCLKDLIVEYHDLVDPVATLTLGKSISLGEALKETGSYLCKGFHYWRDYRDLT